MAAMQQKPAYHRHITLLHMPNIPTYSVVNVCVALLTVLSVLLSAYDWTLRVKDVGQSVTARRRIHCIPQCQGAGTCMQCDLAWWVRTSGALHSRYLHV